MSDNNRNNQTQPNIDGVDKVHDAINRGFTKLYRITLWVMLVLSFLGSIYYTIAYFRGEASIKQMQGMWTFFGIFAVVKLMTVGLDYFLKQRQRKTEEFTPEQIKLPRASNRSLDQTLTYLVGKPVLIVWDILWATMIFAMAVAFSGDADHVRAAARNIVYMCVILVVGHVIFVLYYRFHSYRKKLIQYSRKYINVGNEEEFCELVDQNLREKMRFRSRKFVMSKDYIMGYTVWDTAFQPAAIPIREIESAELSVRRDYGRITRDVGLLSCHLDNGNTVVFCVAQGPHIAELEKVLNYYGFAYRVK